MNLNELKKTVDEVTTPDCIDEAMKFDNSFWPKSAETLNYENIKNAIDSLRKQFSTYNGPDIIEGEWEEVVKPKLLENKENEK